MIYKPTDLSPSAQTFDVMDTPIFFECKVDTSNVQASGFTIEVLDSENNVVFSSIPEGKQLNINYITIINDLKEYVHTYFPDYEIGYSLLNTGYNGSYLKFPFSVAYDNKANNTNTSAINQIFYIPDPNSIIGLTDDEKKISSGLYRNNYIWTTGKNPEYIIDTSKPLIPVKIYNGKEYKWSITLYQLENKGTTKNPVWTLPENPLMFDMPITTGTILGSNNKRIQSAYSEEIYGDYFIQPLLIDGLNYDVGEEDRWTYSGNITQVGSRVAVKSYDMSFGYIYPVEGDNGFQTGTIENGISNAFRIYKNGNNPENLTAYQKVNFVANKALDDVTATEWTIDGRDLGDGTYGYEEDDVVLYNNNIYQCKKGYNSLTVSHIPGKNDAYWDVISDTVELWVDGENLVYCKQNSSIYKRSNKIPCIYPELTSNNISGFDSSIIYYVDDVTKDTNTTKYYKCIKKTTIGIAITNTEYWEETTSSPYWSKKTDESVSEYIQSTIYDVDSFVKNGEKYYECIKKTTTDIEITNTEYWKEINIFNEYKNYSIDNVVGYNNNIYSCIKKIDQKPINGSAYWDLISYKNISYKADDIVGYVDKLYKCKKGYNVDDPIFNTKPSLYGYNQSPSTGDNKSMYWSIYNGQVWEWNESLANQGESYGTFTYYSPTNPNGIYALPDDIFPKTIIGGERIVLNSQLTKASIDNGEYLGSPHNGIYTIVISSQRSYEEYNTSSTYKYGDMVLYEGSIYCCTGSVQSIEPGTSDNWSRYWIGTQSSYNAESYDNDRIYKKDDVIQIFTGKDENGNDEYSYYTCLGTVLGQAPSSADSTYWVKNERNGYRVTVRFNRAPDADSWGELMTKIVYVSGGNTFYGKNIQIKAPNEDGTIDTSDGYGIINQTPFKFIEEKPVEIYKYSFDKYDSSKSYNIGDIVLYNNKKYMCIKDATTNIDISNTEYWEDRTNDIINTTGLIFYNSPITTSNKNGILYIRYFEGIQKGMMLQKLSSDNKYQYFIIDDVGTNGGMYLKYHEIKEFDTYKPYTISDIVASANPMKLTADTTWDIDETKYQIKTYFRESDENAFYFYSRPVVDIQFENTAGVNFVTGKTPYVEATIWEAGRTYSKGDYVYVDSDTRKYFLCISESGVSSDTAPSITDTNWELLTTGINIYKDNINYKKDTIVSYNDIYYIALTNISQSAASVAPEGKNLGIFWETYVGTLYKEDRGFDYSLYNNLKAYTAGDIVFDQGTYYIVLKDIKGKPPTETENSQYYEEYSSWKDTELYSEGELVLYNNKYYVYINDNRNKKNIYRDEVSYNRGDIVKVPDNKVYKWKYYEGQNQWVDIIPDNTDGIYNSNEFWTEYYGFLYVGDYGENTYTNENGDIKSYVDYYYNNVVYYNNQYYIYQNPNLDGISSEEFRGVSINTSLDKLNNNIPKYKTGEPGYNVGDIVLYNNKYYICYKATTTNYFSPANRNYWALYPWQTFITEIGERTVVCNGEYSQQQYIQWKSAQWFLYDATGENIIDKSDVIYDGDLTYTFHGVDGREKGDQGDVIFIVRLVLETRTGYRLTIDKKIEAVYEIEEISSQGLIDAYFDCDTMSVVAVVTKESGFIMPTLEGNNTTAEYIEGDSYGQMIVYGEVDYAKALYSLESASAVTSAADIISDSERFELQSSQKIATDHFSGYITRVQTAIDGSDDVNWQTQGDFGIFIPEMLQEENSDSLDDFNKNKVLKLNPERDMIRWKAKDINNDDYYMGPVEIIENNDNGKKLSEEGILTDVYKKSLYETVSNYQTKNFAEIYGVTSTKEDKEKDNKYPNTNYLPITYATYFKDGSFNVGTVNKYNAETPYNVYDTKTFTLTEPITEMNIKRIQSPLVSRNNFSTDSSNNANKFNVTGFNIIDGNDSDTSKLKTEVYLAEVAPTLISDYAYSETYGIPEGLKYVDGTPITYYRQKNVINDFSEVWKEAGDGEIEFSYWKDGEYITNGDSLQEEVLGSISINNGVPSTINIPGNRETAVFSNTMLFLQERIVNIVAERSYLNGKEFIINADLVMDGNGGLTPYPGDTNKAERVVIYTDEDL